MNNIPPTLIALRCCVTDTTILDALEIATMVSSVPWRLRRADLRAHWQLSQSALHRRLRRIEQAGLMKFETEHGTVLITGLALRVKP